MINQVTIGQSLLAGAIAGGVEATITYPTEYVKTQLQLQSKESVSGGKQAFKGPWDVVQRTVKEKGIKGLYRGLSALVTGTAAKASIRFFSFEELKKRLADESGQLPSSRRMLAGLGAGVIEGLLVVTPTETIKTKLIHDQNSAVPKYKGLVHGMYDNLGCRTAWANSERHSNDCSTRRPWWYLPRRQRCHSATRSQFSGSIDILRSTQAPDSHALLFGRLPAAMVHLICHRIPCWDYHSLLYNAARRTENPDAKHGRKDKIQALFRLFLKDGQAGRDPRTMEGSNTASWAAHL